MTHVAESTHFYTRDGTPAYTVIGANGKERPTNLRDARKMNLVPSVTTIIKCAAAPGLQYWQQQQVMMAALTLPRAAEEPEPDWLKRVMQDSQEQARRARERGTAIHAAIQGFYSAETPQEEFRLHVKGTAEVISWHFPGYGYAPEKSFAHSLGFGGKVDLVLESHAVVDFKTKEFDTTDDLKTWDEHAMQLAAYRHGLGIEKARCAIVYVSTTVPGLAKLIELTEEELQRGWTCFYSLLHFWQAKSVYRSGFAREMVAA